MLENRNNNTIQALKIDKGRLIFTDPVSDSLIGVRSYSLGVLFSCSNLQGEILLIRQENTFALSLLDGRPYVAGFSQRYSSNISVTENSWCTVFVTFDCELSRLRLFVNGICAGTWDSVQGTANPVCEPLTLGDSFEGYVHWVRLYPTAVESVASCIAKEPDETLLLNLDFSKESIAQPLKEIDWEAPPQRINTYLEVSGAGEVIPDDSQGVNQLLADKDFSMLFRIYPIKTTTNESNLFSNDRSCNYSNSYFQVLAKNSDLAQRVTLIVCAGYNGGGPDLPYNQWSTVLVIAQKETNRFEIYANGICCHSMSYGAFPSLSREQICMFGKDSASSLDAYNGRCQAFCVFDKALSASEIAQYSLSLPSENADGLAYDFSFSNGRAIEKKSGRLLQLVGDAAIQGGEVVPTFKPVDRTTNLANALRVGQGGCVKDEEAGSLCRCLEKDQYTLFVQALYEPTNSEPSVLLSCGKKGEPLKEGFSLTIQRGARDLLFIQQGNVINSVPLTQEEEQGWMGITIAYDSDSCMRVFVNGVLKTTFSGIPKNPVLQDAYFGSTPQAQRTFSGYLSCVAVFDRSCPDEAIAAFSEEPPFLLENGIIAYVDFSHHEPRELISGKELVCSGDAGLVVCEDTQTLGNPLRPRLGDDSSSGAYMQWGSTLSACAAAGLPSWLSYPIREDLVQEGGGIPAQYPNWHGSIVRYLLNQFSLDPRIKSLVRGYPYTDTASVLKALYAMQEDGKITALSKLLYPKYAYFLPDIWRWLLESGRPELTKLAEHVAQEINAMPQPPEITYQITLQSITFHHDSRDASETALGIRSLEDYPASFPEWQDGTNSESNPSLALYAADTVGTLYLEVKFGYASTDGTPVELQAKAKNVGAPLLGDAEFTLTVQENNPYTAKVYFAKNNLRTQKPGWLETALEWTFLVNGTETSFTTYHKIYLLSKMPARPWSAIDPEGFVTLAALKTQESILRYYEKTFGSVASCPTANQMAAYVTSWIQGSGLFQASPNQANQLASFDSNGRLLFDRDKFDLSVYKSKAGAVSELSALDCSLLIADCVRLAGYSECGAASLTSGLPGFSVLENGSFEIPVRASGWQEPYPLKLQGVKPLGSQELVVPSNCCGHFIAVTPAGRCLSDTERRVFDAYYTLETDRDHRITGGGYFSGAGGSLVLEENNGYYRESLCEKGSRCVLTPIDAWEHGKADSPVIVKEQGKTGGFLDLLSLPGGPYEEWVMEQVPLRGDQVRCSTVSRDSIYRILITQAVALYTKKIQAEQFEKSLKALTNCLWPGMPSSESEIDARVPALYHQTLETIAALAGLLESVGEKAEEAAGTLRLLAYQMENSVYNLHGGDRGWARELKGAYNPLSWVFLRRKNGSLMLDSASDASQYPFGQLAILQEPFQSNPPEQEGFYLTDASDRARLSCFQECGWIKPEILWFGKGVSKQGDQLEIRFLCSSSNRISCPRGEAVWSASDPVFSINPRNNRWTVIG